MTDEKPSEKPPSEQPSGQKTTRRKNVRAADLAPGQDFEDVFIIDDLQRREKRSGGAYYTIRLADMSGAIEGKIWDHIEAFEQRGYAKDQYVWASGTTTEYKGKTECSIKMMRPVAPGEVEPSDFVPTCPRPLDEMIGEFRALVAGVADAELRGLLELIFHPDSKLWADFIVAPSALKVHQAYLHGLIEHTINVTNNAVQLGRLYPRDIDLDLLTAGALVHDMGKTVEYRWLPRIDQTDIGRLMGHIPIGSNMLHDFARSVALAPGKLAQLHHMILSHHGRHEWGAPRIPVTPEAFVLHFADNADARMGLFEEAAKEPRQRGEAWTPYNMFIQARMFVGGSDFPAERLAEEYGSDARRLAGLVAASAAAGVSEETPEDDLFAQPGDDAAPPRA